MITVVALQFIGIFCLSLAMDKHAKVILGKHINQGVKVATRISGWGSIIISLVWLFISTENIPISMVDWLAYLSLNILITALLHVYFAKRVAH
ncbi:hypothetical protein FX988_03107 [Paraglaciecola mesophila]|uniref:DUF3325 domain-containing protein n=1 Tax=Paraglaciecola mesophila TaxID=197222 RepID=A0A857JLA3_9ALTE|nr:hypothetical protein FX988_03107 [Paraglaciecola mesophila]